jgi:hypothetical protein
MGAGKGDDCRPPPSSRVWGVFESVKEEAVQVGDAGGVAGTDAEEQSTRRFNFIFDNSYFLPRPVFEQFLGGWKQKAFGRVMVVPVIPIDLIGGIDYGERRFSIEESAGSDYSPRLH